MSGIQDLKTCLNCAYCVGKYASSGMCLRTGNYCTTQRAYPSKGCDFYFSGWVHDGVSPMPAAAKNPSPEVVKWYRRLLPCSR